MQFLAGYDDPADREVVAFCAASLAFGRVASVKASISRVLDVLGPHPAAFIRDFSPRQHAAPFADFVHRWTRGADIVALFLIMRHMLRTSPGGTIESFFLQGLAADAPDIEAALESFCTRACEVDVRVAYGGKKPPVRAGVRYFFPRPSGGSGCKRLNLFLRWMVRRDEVDPGGWTGVRPATARHPARYARDSPRPLPAPHDAHESRMEDGGGDHAEAARARSDRSRPLRFFALSSRDDECVRLHASAARLRLSAARALPSSRS